MKKFFIGLVYLLCTGLLNMALSQTYTPIAVSGYTQDGIAETGTSSLAVTTTGLDIQQKVLYSKNFASANSIQLGIDNSGTIVSGTSTWQLAPFDQSNCIFISGSAVPNSSATGSFSVTTPASYSKISVLGFSTEQAATLSVTLGFTDGSIVPLGNVTFKDWFDNTPYVIQGVGRTLRQAAGPYSADGLSGSTGINPRFYRVDLNVPCASQAKLLQSINFAYVSATGAATRTVLLGVSGVGYTPLVITPTVTDASCGQSNGSIAIALSGGTSPFGYIWNTSPVQSAATAINLAAGSYTVTITDANGCTAQSTSTVNQSTTGITFTASANPATICTGETSTLTATLTGSTATTYTWTPGSYSGQTVTLPVATATGTTNYTVTTTEANGCVLTANASVTVKQKPSSTFTVTPTLICLGTSNTVTYTGTGTAAGNYTWDFNGATVQSGTAAGPYSILYGTAGSKAISLQVTENGCTSSTTTNPVSVTAPPSVNFTVSPNAICSGQSVNVTYNPTPSSTATATWQWGGGTPTGTGFGPYTVVYNNTGNITLTASDGPCTVTSPVQTVAVTQQPAASFTADQLISCPGSNGMLVNFTNTSTNTVAGTTYLWQFGDGNTATSFNTSNNYTNTPPASFPVTLTAATGTCTSTSAAQTVQLVPTPVADFSATPGTNTPIQLSQAQFYFLNLSTDATNYKWEFGNGDTSHLTNVAYTYPGIGTYTVSLIASNNIGCADTVAYQYFVVVPDSTLKIPNAFSPNGDGINDTWIIKGLSGYPHASINVFNRGGQEVFTSIGYNTPWDGLYKGSPVPVGTYYYIIVANGIKYTGWLLVIR